MKRYSIPIFSVLVVLAVALISFGEPEGTQKKRSGRGEGTSSRRGMGRERRQKAITTIEGELTKLKTSFESSSATRKKWQDLSEEERKDLRSKFRKLSEQRQQSIVLIEEQLAKLKGRRRLKAEHEKSIDKLKAIRQLAVKEKATETTAHIDNLIAGQQKEYEAKLKKLGLQRRSNR